jgi:hypothetical protein
MIRVNLEAPGRFNSMKLAAPVILLLVTGCVSKEQHNRDIEEQCFKDLSFGKEPVDQFEVEERWDRAIKKLGEIRSEKAIPFLVRFIRESHVQESITYDYNVRLVFDSAEALGKIGQPALPEVKKLLYEEDVMLRRFALIALSQMKTEETQEAIALLHWSATQDQSGRNRRLAMAILSRAQLPVPEAHQS